MNEDMKTVTEWAIDYGVNDRSARNWYKRLGFEDGHRIIGTLVKSRVKLTLSEWKHIMVYGPKVPGIKKGYKYSSEAMKSRNLPK